MLYFVDTNYIYPAVAGNLTERLTPQVKKRHRNETSSIRRETREERNTQIPSIERQRC
jgi:hypothetical protein